MYYFAYGSNMNPERMKERDVSFTMMKKAVLKGYRLQFNKLASGNPSEGYANIEPWDKGIVEGILYDISEADIKKLDKHEGYPAHYSRINLKVKLKDSDELEAVVYIAQADRVKEGLKPRRAYLQHLLAGEKLLSPEYIKQLRLQETLD